MKKDVVSYFQLILEMDFQCRQNLIKEFLQIQEFFQDFVNYSSVMNEKIPVLLNFYKRIYAILEQNQKLFCNACSNDEAFFEIAMNLIAFFSELHEFQFQIFEYETFHLLLLSSPVLENILFHEEIQENFRFRQEQAKIKILIQERTVNTMILEIENKKGE